MLVPDVSLPEQVLAFWFGAAALDVSPPAAVRRRWFGGGPAFDEEIRERFGALLDAPDEVGKWAGLGGRLAAIVVLDQFSRQLFRGQARAFATDEAALALAEATVAAGDDLRVGPVQRGFVYLPYQHAESREVQARSLVLHRALRDDPRADDGVLATIPYAERHAEMIERFGRFPGRNPALGRSDTAEEAAYVAAGGDTFGARAE